MPRRVHEKAVVRDDSVHADALSEKLWSTFCAHIVLVPFKVSSKTVPPELAVP